MGIGVAHQGFAVHRWKGPGEKPFFDRKKAVGHLEKT